MKKTFHLAIALFSAISLTTSTFAGRGSEEPAPVPVVPIVTPIPTDPTPEVPESDVNNGSQNNDQNNNPQQGFSSSQMAAAGISGAAAGLALGGAAAYTKGSMKLANDIDNLVKIEKIKSIGRVSGVKPDEGSTGQSLAKALEAVDPSKSKDERKAALSHLEMKHKNIPDNSHEKEFTRKLLHAIKNSQLTAGERMAAGYRGFNETIKIMGEREEAKRRTKESARSPQLHEY